MAKRYQFPPVGTQLKPKENNLDYPEATDQDATNAYKQAAAQATALRHNEVLVDEYNAKFQNWLDFDYNVGRAVGPKGVGDPKAQPPFQPPAGFMAVLCLGEDGVTKYWDQQQVGPPVCKQPKFDKITAPQH